MGFSKGIGQLCNYSLPRLKVNEGMEIGGSLFDEEGAKIVPEIMEKAKKLGVEIILPVDFVCSSKFGEDGEIQTASKATGVPAGFMGLDCGEESAKLNAAAVAASKTILWNGPMGVFEMGKFEGGVDSRDRDNSGFCLVFALLFVVLYDFVSFY